MAANDLTVYVEKDEDDCVVSRVFCSRACAEADFVGKAKVKATRMPTGVAGITGFALALVCCESCGDNLMDVVCKR